MTATLPAAVREGVERALAGGAGARIASVERVGGGCVSPAARVRAQDGRSAFVKWDEAAPGMFAAEAEGLRRLAEPGAVRIPAVMAVGDGWLLLEWLEPGSGTAGMWEALGRALAALHRHGASTANEPGPARFGAERDNFIGPLPQANGELTDWASFWRTQRLLPQLRRARDEGRMGDAHVRSVDALMARLPELIGAIALREGASLLHGDLWHGNVLACASGEMALVDPSSYRGHREVDLAMAELFGGFHSSFHAAYREAWPLADGYAPARRAVYQLYYLLVHVNLFGGGYVAQTLRAVEEAF